MELAARLRAPPASRKGRHDDRFAKPDRPQRGRALTARHRKEIWADHGPQRRQPGRSPGRGDCAARRKRRRQVHARLHHFRPRSTDNRVDDLAGTGLCARCAGRRAVGGNRTYSPGNATPAGPVDRRECVCRTPPDAGRPYRSRVHELPRRRATAPLGPRRFAHDFGARPQSRRPTASRDRQGANAQRALAGLR